MLPVREKTIEEYLRKQVTTRGGKCLKWSSPQCNGVPDRIVMLNKQIWFVEVKSPTGRLTALQEVLAVWMIENGYNYRVVKTKDDVNGLIAEIMA